MQSDVEDTAVHMRDLFETYGGNAFKPSPQHTIQTNGDWDQKLVTSISLEEEDPQICDMRDDMNWSQLPWLKENPIGVPTERELFSEEHKRTIFRFLLVRQ